MFVESAQMFLKVTRGKSQSEILKNFLHHLISKMRVSEAGSVHVFNPTTGKLFLFNDDDFLFKLGYLRPGENWQETFAPWEGLAGRAFASRQTLATSDADADARFSRSAGDVPVKPIVCIPVLLSRQQEPFGVASFHNDALNEQLSTDTIQLVEWYTEMLGLALEASKEPLSLERNSRVFIVHGHDELALAQLENVLRRNALVPVVLRDQPKAGAEILEKLREEVNRSGAGFVLLTPDDEGRTKGAPSSHPRARENVMFESGYLVAQFRDQRRVCFLVRQPIELPSDLKGLLVHHFDTIQKASGVIEDVLEEWRMIPPRRSGPPPREES